jgi:hypothetical protein
MDIVSLIVLLVIIGLLFWAVATLGATFGIPAPIITVIQVLLVIVVVLGILRAFGLWSGGPILVR